MQGSGSDRDLPLNGMNAEVLVEKKITVMGLGLHGGGAAMVAWLVKHGAHVTVTDLKNREALLPTIQWLGKSIEMRVTWVLGKHRAIDFRDADFIVQNPGVSRTSQYLAIARRAGIPIVNEASLFFQFCPSEIIGVTGTRGKSTTASLIHHILAGGLPDRRVWLAGLPNRPMMSFIDRVHRNDIVILELSSWQLEMLGQYHRSPHVAVVTNIYPDHLNTYPSMSAYVDSKRHIYRWQSVHDLAVFNADDPKACAMARNALGKVLLFSRKRTSIKTGTFVKNGYIMFRHNKHISRLVRVKDSPLAGDHNVSNILAALAVSGSYGVHPIVMRSTLMSFKSLPGRIELVRTVGGIRFINDTTATTPDATMAALNVLKKNVVLIAGGASKKIPISKYRELASVIEKTCRAVVLLDGQGSVPIQRALQRKKFPLIVDRVVSMAEAVALAQSFAKRGDTVLMSPAAASFGMFINEFDRGDQFCAAVKSI